MNTGPLSFCVTVFTFSGYHSFRLSKTMGPQVESFVVVIWLPILFFQQSHAICSLFASWLVKHICFVRFHFFALFLFFLILLQNHCNLQRIHTFGASRVGETLTCANTTVFTMVQAPFFQGGGFGEAKSVIGVSNSLFSKTFLFSSKNEFDDSYTLWASGPPSGRPFYEQILWFT